VSYSKIHLRDFSSLAMSNIWIMPPYLFEIQWKTALLVLQHFSHSETVFHIMLCYTVYFVCTLYKYTFIHICTELLGFWTFSIVRYSKDQETRRFGNRICFRLQVKGEDTQLGPLERANLDHWRWSLSKGSNWVGVFPRHLRTETDPVSETSPFLVSRIPDDGKSPKT
jgi:hypothetical protein